MKPFPPGFLFGSATSAHQVEGGTTNDWTDWESTHAGGLARRARKSSAYGQGPSPVWPGIQAEAKDPVNYISGRAADHYARYAADVAAAGSLGLNAHRLSIEWSRVEPRPGEYDEAAIAHYVDVAAACWEHGQEPWVTLWHFTLPQWAAAAGGFTSAYVAQRFAAYAQVMARALRPHVRHWATLNEPEVYSAQGYLLGIWPPGVRSWRRYAAVRLGLVRAHIDAYDALKAVDSEFEVGFCTSQSLIEAQSWWLAPTARTTSHFTNDYFVDRLAPHCDWLGVQYYIHRVVDRGQRGRISDLGWELHPEGHATVLGRLAAHGKPLYVTESGLADRSDRYRADYIEQSLESIAEAIADGIDCRGYFYWSLLDNFEWHEGFWPKFGLIAVDRATMNRTVRPSAQHYAEIVRRNRHS